MAGFLCFSQRWRRKFLCHIFEILWFYHYVDSFQTPSRLKLQALQVDDKLKMFQVIDFIEFSRKKHHFLTYFLRLFSFPFLYFSQETVFFVDFVQILAKRRFSYSFFIRYVNSDLKTAGGYYAKFTFYVAN